MRLLVNARFLTQRVTGTQRYARELTRELINMLGKECLRLVAPEGGPEEYAGVPVLRCGGSLKGHAWEQFVLPYVTKRLGTDLLWCPINCGPLLVSRQVVTIHDAEVFAVPKGLNPIFVRWYRFLLPQVARKAGRVLTDSHFSKSELLKHLGVSEDTIKVIHIGVGPEFRPLVSSEITRIRAKYGLPDRYILTLASRTPHKNLGGVLQAWKALRDQTALKDVGLAMVGGLSRCLQADISLIELAGLPMIIDLGYVPDEDLPALYCGATAFVYASFYEGFGLPPLEAMACGTPVVVSNSASLPEVVGDAGVYVNSNDTDDIARGIYQVLSDESLRHKLQAGGQARARLFTWEKTARQTLDVFEEMLQEHRRAI